MIGDEFPEILRSAKAGDEGAFRAVYRDLAPSLLRFAYSRGDREPEEAVGDVMESMVRSLSSFQGDEAAFRSWVFTIAYRRTADRHRKAARTVRSELLVSPDHASTSTTPESEVMGRLSSGPLGRALNDLTRDQRDVILLRFIADLPLESTAKIVRKRVSAVKMLQMRALDRLRATLGDDYVS